MCIRDRVRVRDWEMYLRIDVTDTGRGIPEHSQGTISQSRTLTWMLPPAEVYFTALSRMLNLSLIHIYRHLFGTDGVQHRSGRHQKYTRQS